MERVRQNMGGVYSSCVKGGGEAVIGDSHNEYSDRDREKMQRLQG